MAASKIELHEADETTPLLPEDLRVTRVRLEDRSTQVYVLLKSF